MSHGRNFLVLVVLIGFALLALLARVGEAAQDPWEELKANAKKEGELVLIVGLGAGRSLGPAIEHFGEKFGIKTVVHSGRGREEADRLLAERRAGIYSADVMIYGATTMNRLQGTGVFDPILDHIVRDEVRDTRNWFQQRHWFAGADQKYVFAFAGEPRAPMVVQYNTTRVPNKYVAGIKSLWDWLDPRWAGGKIVSLPIGEGGAGTRPVAYALPGLGPKFIRAFIEMEPFQTDEARVITDGLVKGRFALAMFIGGISRDIDRMEKKGFPVTTFDVYKQPLKEGYVLEPGGVSQLAILNRPKNPDAAKLFVNWWLSREGQTAMHEKSGPIGAHQSLREDVPVNGIDVERTRRQGVNYTFPATNPRITAMIREALEFEKKVLRELREKKSR